MRNAISTAAFLFAIYLGVSCAGSQPVPGGATGLEPAVELPAPGSLSPREVSSLLPARGGGDFETEGLAPQNVSAVGEQGRFEPYYINPPEPDPFSPAYALYTFYLTDLSGPQTLTTVWQVPILADELWVGLGNRDEDAWDWFMLYPEGNLKADVDEIGRYLDETDRLLAVVLTIGDATCNLSHLYFLESPPLISSVSPTSGFSGSEVEFSAHAAGLTPFDYTWDFGGAATPNESTESSPAVILGAAGTYEANLTIANFFGPSDLQFVLEVTEAYQPGTGELSAQFATDSAGVGDAVRVLVSCGDFPHPFQFMDGVAVTVEENAEYADMSFNPGAPSASYGQIDGVWTQVDPTMLFLPEDFLYTESPVDGEPDLVYIAFSIVPLDGQNTFDGGDLFNFEMQFLAPGTYHLGFLEFQDVKRTYYADDMANEYYWNNIANGDGINTIVISE